VQKQFVLRRDITCMSFHRRLMEQESDEKSKGSYTMEDMRRLSEESEDTITEDFNIDEVLESNKTHSRHEIFKPESKQKTTGKIDPNTCDTCGKKFDTQTSAQMHKLRAHSKESERKFQGQVLGRLDEILRNVRANRRR